MTATARVIFAAMKARIFVITTAATQKITTFVVIEIALRMMRIIFRPP